MSRESVSNGKGSRVHSLCGGKIASRKIALRGMRGLEKELTTRSARDWARQREVTKQLNRVYAPLRKISGDDEYVDELLRGFRSRYSGFRKRKPSRPTSRKDTERIYLGSLGARVAPPYDYSWVFRDPDPGDVGLTANAANGEMSFLIDSFGNDDYNSSAGIALGIYFRPVTDVGRLAVWSDPSFADSWYDYAWFSASHSDAFMGLYIGSYDDNGNFTGAVVNQQHSLWDDDSHVSDSGHHEDPNPGYFLNASCTVDRSHQYIIWVWAGGRAAADQVFGAASAGSALYVVIPSITWELT